MSSLLELPSDVRGKIIALLPQRDQAALLVTCKDLYDAVFPHIYRMFRCVNCSKNLFPPCELRGVPNIKTRTSAMFLELRLPGDDAHSDDDDEVLNCQQRSSCCGDGAEGAQFAQLGLTIDERTGAANFHVLQHLARTMYSGARFPFPEETRRVNTLRCEGCGVFVGFRKDGRAFVHADFLELVDESGKARSIRGPAVPPRDAVRCEQCAAALFDVSDVLQWTHVLASNRLTDFDAYLEWDHGWGGEPAFFVKRLRKNSYQVNNVRVVQCRQGDMEVGDVTCASCDAFVGFKFLAEVGEAPLRNYDQVGRFGVVRSCVTPSEPRSCW